MPRGPRRCAEDAELGTRAGGAQVVAVVAVVAKPQNAAETMGKLKVIVLDGK